MSESQSKYYPTAVTLLFCQAFEHMGVWQRSHVYPSNRKLATILDICFTPRFRPEPSPQQHESSSWDLIFYLVRRSGDPWYTIRRLLPGEETWEICIMLVKRYLAMPREYVTTQYCIRVYVTLLTCFDCLQCSFK